MPMYEYKCSECGLVFEARQKFSDKPLTKCRACGGAVSKLISQSCFALKGGGWFEQGYSANKSPKKSSPASSGNNTQKAAS